MDVLISVISYFCILLLIIDLICIRILALFINASNSHATQLPHMKQAGGCSVRIYASLNVIQNLFAIIRVHLQR